MPRAIIFLFPGQSSRDASMFDRIDRIAPGHGAMARARVEALNGVAFEGRFSTNREIQTGVLEATLTYLELARAAGLTSQASAGMSLGEYAHLTDIGAISADEARALVAARGACYDAGPSGVMAALQPIGAQDAQRLAEKVCTELGDADAVAVSNINSPAQCVVSGRADGVQRVLSLAEAECSAFGTVIEHRVPMHMPRFRPVASAFRPWLATVEWRLPRADYWPNVEGVPRQAPAALEIIDCLTRHVYEPVQWRGSVDGMMARFDRPLFVEVGPLQALSKLMTRRWAAASSVYALDLMDNATPCAFARRIEEIHDDAAR